MTGEQAGGAPIGPASADETGWAEAVMSATSLALLVLLPVEVTSWVLAKDVASLDAADIAQRWSAPTWRAIDWVFLVVAMLHGALGMVALVRSRLRSEVSRSAWTGAVLAGPTALVLLGSYTLFTFEVV